MKQIKNILLAAIGVITLFSCNKKIEELQSNPNKPTSTPPNLILSAILTDISGTQTNGTLGDIQSWGAVQRWNQYYCRNYSYYGDNQYTWQSASFDPYLVLKNIAQMETEATSRGAAAVNPYKAIGKFVKGYYFYNLTSLMGDVPLNDALSGAANLAPSYTPQKQVFQYVLNILDSANTDLTALINASDNSLLGDIYYSNNLAQWRKLVNSFKLRVLISLSNKAADPDLNVPAQFAKIINNPAQFPIFQSVADDLAFVYQPIYNIYPRNPADYGSNATRFNMAQTYVKSLTDLRDARVYVTCEPAWKLVDSLGYTPTDFKAFVGASTGAAIGQMSLDANAGRISLLNRKKYSDTYVGEADVLVGYKELCFNIAEAINRGWITGNDETWYVKGITESMKFYGLDPSGTSFTAYFLQPGNAIGNYTGYPFTFDFNTYYNQSAVLYAGGATGISQIILQKYLAMYQNSGWEAYFNYRRTGVPAFQGGTGVGNNGIIPKRWGYPVSEQSVNTANWKAALANQQFSTDDINGSMWLIK